VASLDGGAPSLAVVVPTLNEREALPALVASLGAEGGPDELVVVDGGSDDGTQELARALGASVLASPCGRGAQLARGARAARSELLLFLHADMRVAPGALAAVRAAFRDPGVVASGLCQRVAAPGAFSRLVERAADARVRLGRVYGDSGLAVRRSAYDAVGGFREDLPLFEDLELSRRLRRAGRIVLVDATLEVSGRRWRSEGALRCTLRNWALTAAWSLGVDPARLVRYYPPYSARTAKP
jgi:rSAM/selenodomain-associated transferase 2